MGGGLGGVVGAGGLHGAVHTICRGRGPGGEWGNWVLSYTKLQDLLVLVSLQLLDQVVRCDDNMMLWGHLACQQLGFDVLQAMPILQDAE